MERGWEVIRLANWRLPGPPPPDARPVAVYAEPLFAEAVADQTGRILLEPPPGWLPSLPREFLLRAVGLDTLDGLRAHAAPRFVKPAEGKVFEPRVYPGGSELPPPDQVDGSLPVLWSDPVHFELEVRCFVQGGEILALSPYWRNGALAQDSGGDWPFESTEEQEATDFIHAVLKQLANNIPPAFVLDVGRIQDRGWAVIEGNPCWGAGLYGCPAGAALDTGLSTLVPRGAMTPDLWKWTSPRVQAG